MIKVILCIGIGIGGFVSFGVFGAICASILSLAAVLPSSAKGDSSDQSVGAESQNSKWPTSDPIWQDDDSDPFIDAGTLGLHSLGSFESLEESDPFNSSCFEQPDPFKFSCFEDDFNSIKTMDDHCINPATGLPMIGGACGFDVEGNTYGFSDSEDMFNSDSHGSFDNDLFS